MATLEETAYAEPIGKIDAVITAEIRLCRESDLSGLEWMGLYAQHRGVIRQTFEAQQRGDALMLLAVSAEFPIAQIWIDLKRTDCPRTAEFWAIRTFWPLQGRGIGRRMLWAAEKVIRNLGYVRAELEVERTNKGAVRFYQNLGWIRFENDPMSDVKLRFAKCLQPK